MESVALFFATHSTDFLQSNKMKILENYEKLLNDKEYRDAIQFATGDRNRVVRRFELAVIILGDV